MVQEQACDGVISLAAGRLPRPRLEEATSSSDIRMLHQELVVLLDCPAGLVLQVQQQGVRAHAGLAECTVMFSDDMERISKLSWAVEACRAPVEKSETLGEPLLARMSRLVVWMSWPVFVAIIVSKDDQRA